MSKLPQGKLESGKPKLTFGEHEKYKSGNRGNALTDSCCKCRTCNSHITDHDQYVIKNSIYNTCTDHKQQAHRWPSRCDQIHLKQRLQHTGRNE